MTILETLVPELQEQYKKFEKKANNYLASQEAWVGYRVRMTQAKRTREYQAGLFSEGRRWNSVKKEWLVVDKGRIVTWTCESKHCDRKAFDICIVTEEGKAIWPDPSVEENKKMWLELARIGKALGLWPGALWTGNKKDYSHYSSEEE